MRISKTIKVVIVFALILAFVFTTAVHAQPTGTDKNNTQLPDGWNSKDVYKKEAQRGLAGSSGYNNGVFTLKGSGENIWGSVLAFHFTYREMKGDGELTARIKSMGNTGDYSKAGLMICDDVNKPVTFFSMDLTPSKNGEFLWNETGNETHCVYDHEAGTAPYWIKLERKGNCFRGYVSRDGLTWKLVRETYYKITDKMYIGMYVCSCNKKKLISAEFDNISFKQPTGSVLPSSLEEEVVCDFDSRIKYTGKWGIAPIFDTNAQGAAATLDFKGTRVKILGCTKPWGGTANIYIDGKLIRKVNCRGINDDNVNSFEIEGLASGSHTIKMEAAGNGFIYLDNILYYSEKVPPKAVKVKLPAFKTTINGDIINNKKMSYPMLLYMDTTYLPMNPDICKALGISTSSEKDKLVIQKDTKTEAYKPVIFEEAGYDSAAEYYAEPVKVPVYVNGKKLDNSSEKYPILFFRGTVYVPMTDRFAVKEFGCKIKMDKKQGFSIIKE